MSKLKIAWKHILFFLGLSTVLTTPYLLHSYKGENEHARRICFVGDVGTNTDPQKRIAKKLGEECDRVYVLGDLVYPIGIKNEKDPRAYTHFIRHYKDLGIPFWLVLGNHDYYGNADAWLKVAEKHKWIKFKNNFWYTNENGLCIVGLDTMPLTSLKKGPRYKAQANWIRNVLAEKCNFRIVIGHHPYKSCGKHGHATGGIKKFYEDFVIGRVDGVIAGHDHLLCYFNEKPFHITSGAGGKLRNKIKNEPTYAIVDFGFVKMEYHGEKKATFTFISEKEKRTYTHGDEEKN